MSRPVRRLVLGLGLAVVAGTALVIAVRAVRALGGEEVPRPAVTALSGAWQRTDDPPREAPPQADAWPRLAEVASFTIADPEPGQVTVHLQDGSQVIGQVRQAMEATMVVSFQGGASVTIGRLGARGAVVMASGAAMISFLPSD